MNKIGFLVLLATVALVRGSEEFECPAPGGAYPHEEYCDYYYLCVEYNATLQKCPKDQYFDLKYDGCNWDYLVDCGTRVPSDPETTEEPGPTDEPEPTGEPGEFECPTPGGAFPHEIYCDYYYLCVANVSTLEQCDADMFFDLKYDGCNWEYLVDCGHRVPSNPDPTEEPEPTEDPGDFECPAAGGAYPHDEFCELYYECFEYVATLKECPERQLFDLNYDGCNWEEQVDCGTRQRPSEYPDNPETTTPGGPGEDFECPTADGLYANPNDCTSYYNCANYIPTLMHCPPDLYFRIEVAVCDFKDNVNCGDRPIPS